MLNLDPVAVEFTSPTDGARLVLVINLAVGAAADRDPQPVPVVTVGPADDEGGA